MITTHVKLDVQQNWLHQAYQHQTQMFLMKLWRKQLQVWNIGLPNLCIHKLLYVLFICTLYFVFKHYSTDHLVSFSWPAAKYFHVLISSSPQHEVGSSNSLWECRGDKSSSQPTAHRDRHTGSPLLLASPPSSLFMSTPLPPNEPENKQHNTLRGCHIK